MDALDAENESTWKKDHQESIKADIMECLISSWNIYIWKKITRKANVVDCLKKITKKLLRPMSWVVFQNITRKVLSFNV